MGEGNTHSLLLGLQTDVVFLFPYNVCAKDKLFCRNHSCLLDQIYIVDIPSQVTLLSGKFISFPMNRQTFLENQVHILQSNVIISICLVLWVLFLQKAMIHQFKLNLSCWNFENIVILLSCSVIFREPIIILKSNQLWWH